MNKYSVVMKRTLDTTKSVGNIIADPTTPRRGKVFRLIVSSEATPADAMIGLQVQRCTTAGTATAVTPRPLDSNMPAAINKANQNHTAEPTLTAGEIPIDCAFHQRQTFQFFAIPGYELVFPGVASNGFAIRTPTVSAGTPQITATLHYEE